jgi:integrase
MATLQKRNGSFRVLFCFHGKRHTLTLGKVSQDEAEAFAGNVDLLLLRLKQRLLQLPPAMNIEEFILHGGKPPDAAPASVHEPILFYRFKEQYLETHQNGAMEENSLSTVRIHLNHFERTLGERFPVQELTLADLQRHLNRRQEVKYRGKKLSPITLRKEMASFRAAWNWATHMSLVQGAFPSCGLVYPKADEKMPFMTWQEIERKIDPTMKEGERAELWDCLYLTQPELEELLQFVQETAIHEWIYVMFCCSIHTGVRRSEMLRVRISDIDFEAQTVLIREKKRSRKQRTTRRVPLTPFLSDVLKKWLQRHPGGDYLFCHQEEVAHSKKRSKTTGHKGEKTRATSLKERMRTVTRRERPCQGPSTKDEAHDHFKRVLAGSKWEVVRGWHCFRHSFISLCASQGVDQRLIDEWVGHQTEEQRRRYRHLLPSIQQQAIRSVFGG